MSASSQISRTIKQCPYCGRDHEDSTLFCPGCGTSLTALEKTQRAPNGWFVTLLFAILKPVAIVFGFLAAVGIPLFFGLFIILGFIFHLPEPDQPKFGFNGDWRCPSVFGFEERPLPPAVDVWRDYEACQPTTNEHSSLYLARLGGAARQSSFQSWTGSGDTPVGAQRYTHVEFVYTDPTNGVYILSWSLRGNHDTSFLRFDATQRLYQLRPYGTPGEFPPRLSIVSIEGIRPENYVGR